MRPITKIICICSLVLAMATTAHAIPELQIYIEGSTYNTGSETWVTSDSAFKLWVLGDVGAKENIDGVRLSAAFITGETGTITLTPTTATAPFTDPSTPGAPGAPSAVAVGTVPLLGDGSALPSHGIYGDGTSWISWLIGDFTLTDSPIGDYMSSVPITFPDMGQINVYDVVLNGFTQVHFDAYGHYWTNKGDAKYINAPFSHDGQGGGDDGGGGGGGGTPVPEPSTLLLLGAGFVGLGIFGRRKLNK